jgi:hypothetical protein
MSNTGPFTGAMEADVSVPPPYQGTTGLAYLGAINAALNSVWQKSLQAQLIHMPGLGDPTQLPLLGDDRLLVQGAFEYDQAFVERLSNAFATWQIAGNAWSELQQVAPQLASSPTPFPITLLPGLRIVTDQQQWWYYPENTLTDLAATPPFFVNTGTGLGGYTSWNWDSTGPTPDKGLGAAVNRWWLILNAQAPNNWCVPWPVLDTAGQPNLDAAPGSSLDFANVSPSYWASLRAILETWRSANSWCRAIVVTFGDILQPDNRADGVNNPNGGWGYGYEIVAGQYQASALFTCPVVPGTPAAVQPGSANDKDQSATWGYRIVQGQYISI